MSDECKHDDKSSLIDITTLGDKIQRYLCFHCNAVILGDPVLSVEEMRMSQEYDMMFLRSIND